MDTPDVVESEIDQRNQRSESYIDMQNRGRGLHSESYIDMQNRGLQSESHIDMQNQGRGLHSESYIDMQNRGLQSESYIDMQNRGRGLHSESYMDMQNQGLTRSLEQITVGNRSANEREYENAGVPRNENPPDDNVNEYEGLNNPRENHEYASLGVQ